MNYEHWRHYARGWLLHVFGREEQAFNEYAAAYRLKPDDVQAARHLASIAARKQQYDVADKWFVETLRLAPMMPIRISTAASCWGRPAAPARPSPPSPRR